MLILSKEGDLSKSIPEFAIFSPYVDRSVPPDGSTPRLKVGQVLTLPNFYSILESGEF
jgi:hypothetical protein